MSVIADVIHVDTSRVPVYCRAEDASGVETADGAVMPIAGSGIIVGVEGVIREDASHALLSGSQLCIDRCAAVILDSDGAVAVIDSGRVESRVKCIITHSLDTTHKSLSLKLSRVLSVRIAISPIIIIDPVHFAWNLEYQKC